MRVLGIIPARGGSKGIPKKNLTPFMGRPLLAWTVDVALGSGVLDRVILSTDDIEIAELGRKLGVDVPFIRPDELSGDTVPTLPVLQHAVEFIEREGEYYDAVFTLQVTNPLRQTSDVRGAVDLLERTGADSVISFCEVGDWHPARMKSVDQEGRVHDPPFAESFEGQPRQQLPRYYLRIGNVYLTRRNVLMEQGSLKGMDCRAWLVPRERAINIDTEVDLFIAECLWKRFGEKRDG